MTATSPVRVMLVDGHVLCRQALGCLLATYDGLDVTGEAGTLAHALAVSATLRPDVVLLSLAVDGDLSVDAIPPLVAATAPAGRLLVLTALADHGLHRQAVRKGARGIVHTFDTVEALVRAIRKVHEGEVWIERRLVAELVALPSHAPDGAWARAETLTRRERDVVRLVAEGLKNKPIADRLSISDVTVRHHLTSVYAKLGVNDRLSLVVYAFQTRPGHPRGQTTQDGLSGISAAHMCRCALE